MYKEIVVLTGAGISAESGIATFRNSGGLWAQYRVEDVATPEAYRANPGVVQEFYNMRRRELKNVSPTAAHHALARLERESGRNVTVITQNVDDLHERAGTKNLVHMHGELLKIRCEECGHTVRTEEDCSMEAICPRCGEKGVMRPDIVWFGEMPMHMDLIGRLLEKADLFLSIGTSGAVYPAADFVRILKSRGKAHTVELNLEKSHLSSLFHEKIHGKASIIVPDYVDSLLKNQ